MTNAEIIVTAMVNANLNPEEVEVNTFVGWKRNGYSVKRGEKAVFSTKIWKPCKFKKVEEENSADVADDANKDETPKKRLMLVTAHFFTDEQVERKVVSA